MKSPFMDHIDVLILVLMEDALALNKMLKYQSMEEMS